MSRYTEQEVRLIGNLVRDARIHPVGESRECLSLRVATNSYVGRDGDGNTREHTEYHDVVAFGAKGRFDRLMDANVLGRGAKVCLRGEIRTRTREVKGEERMSVSILVRPSEVNVLEERALSGDDDLARDDLPPRRSGKGDLPI